MLKYESWPSDFNIREYQEELKAHFLGMSRLLLEQLLFSMDVPDASSLCTQTDILSDLKRGRIQELES